MAEMEPAPGIEIPSNVSSERLRSLLVPKPSTLTSSSWQKTGEVALVTTIGFAIYGYTVGYWRHPMMACYVAIKMPLLIACTLGCNVILNGLLGLLLGSGLGIRQSLHALLSAFAISAMILASLAPISFFMTLNTPEPDSAEAANAHAGYLLTHTFLIGIAGLIGVIQLGRLLRGHCPTPAIAKATLSAWIAGNAFLGAQFSWILRPFFGSPSLEVAFLRENPMHGRFYEAVYRSLGRFFSLGSFISFLGLCAIASAALYSARKHRLKTTP